MNKLLVTVSLILGSVANLTTQILIPRFLQPQEYANFTLWWSVGLLVTAIVYEATRNSVIRFSDGKDDEQSKKRRSLLLLAYAVGSLGLTIIACFIFIGTAFYKFELISAATLLFATSQGVFDGKQAIARALFDDRSFAFTGLLRSILFAAVVPIVALWSESGVAVMFAMAVCQFVPLLFYNKIISLYAIKLKWDGAEFRYLGAFAFDYSQRIYGIIAMIVNIVLLQTVIRKFDFVSEDEKGVVAGGHMMAVFMLMAPFAFLLILIQPIFLEFFIAPGYEKSYSDFINICIFASGLLAFKVIGVDVLFVIAGKSKWSFVSPLVLLISFYAYILVGGEIYESPVTHIISAVFFGLAISLIFSIAIIYKIVPVIVPFKDLIVVGFALLALFFISNLDFDVYFGTWIGMALSLCISLSMYFAIVIGLDACNSRKLLNSLKK